MKQTYEGKITISRPNCGDGSECINIQIRDNNSKARFVEVQIGYSDFAQALTGLAQVPCEFNVTSLEVVGKVREVKQLEFPLTGVNFGSMKKLLAATLVMHFIPEGWECDKDFGNQDSFFTLDDVQWARCSIYRYVEPTGE